MSPDFPAVIVPIQTIYVSQSLNFTINTGNYSGEFLVNDGLSFQGFTLAVVSPADVTTTIEW
jgi:hypothetical protein